MVRAEQTATSKPEGAIVNNKNDNIDQSLGQDQGQFVNHNSGSNSVEGTSQKGSASQGFSNSELRQDRDSQRLNTDNDIQDDNIGGRPAGGNAGTGGVGTNDVGHNRGSKQSRLER
jgi:hypothetical protein